MHTVNKWRPLCSIFSSKDFFSLGLEMTYLSPIFFLFTLLPFCISQGNDAETVIRNAAFEDVAPCPCDLTSGACDIKCCCDTECTANQRETFDGCIPFLPGGQDAETQQYKCESKHFNPEDWFPLLCVEFEYNAFLGYFYDWQFKLASNIPAVLERLFTVSFYWFREEESRAVTDTGVGYRNGISVKTGKPVINGTLQQSGILTIPQPSLSGQCLQSAPVRYLEDLDLSCTYEVTESQCSSSSVLSALFFIQDSSLTGNNAQFFSVLAEEAGPEIAATNVIYKCADAAFLSSYLRSTQSTLNIDNTQAYLFNYTLPSDPACQDSCGNDICIDLNNLTNPDPVTTTTVPPDCPLQTPTGPAISGTNNETCTNVVIDVEYQITWNASQIAQLDATITVANVSFLNSLGASNALTQRYRVSYVHLDTSVREGNTDNFNNITDAPYERSGRVGYDKGRKLFSGSVVNNETTTPFEFIYVNTNSTRQMAVFGTSPESLCINAGRQDINFGVDISTSCRVLIGLAEFSDCSGLRKLIINRLNALMPSNVLGRRGYNDQNNRGYWVDVLREDLSELCIFSEYFPVGLSPIDNRTGICRNITNAIHLDVFYAETGRSNGFPIYEVLGSKVSFSNTTWEVRCSGLNGGVCDSSNTQSFYLTSSVKFTQIPPQTPEPVAKYYETPEEDDRELCPQDRCWDNLFYPLTGRYRYISETREYVFGMVSVSIIFFVGYLLVIQTYW